MKEIAKGATIDGTIAVPASKSLTNRSLLLAMIAEGETTIVDPLDCDDSRFMLECVRRLGFEVEGSVRSSVTIGPRTKMYAEAVELFVGNAGTAMRFLTGFLPFVPGRFIVRGEQRMHERPIGDLVEALGAIGAEIEYLENEGYPPISIRGRMMRGGLTVPVDGSLSSQFISALMMGSAAIPGGMTLEVRNLVSLPYIHLTAGILREFGAEVTIEDGRISVVPAGGLSASEYRVEGDYSSASYWFGLAAATGGRIEVRNVSRPSTQGDRRFLEILTEMGNEVEAGDDSVIVNGRGLTGGVLDMNDIPDTVPTLAAIAPLASDPIEIVNVANLRVKESDRIAVLASELRKLGATVEEREDGLKIEPGWSSEPAVIDPHGDHRIAMAFAIAGVARGGVSIEDERVVAKSYPRFWRDLASLLGDG